MVVVPRLSLDASCWWQTPDRLSLDSFSLSRAGYQRLLRHTCALVAVLLLTLAGLSNGAQAATVFADDFDRADGPVDGWTVVSGDWNISNGKLMIGPTAQEQDIFAGDPAVSLPSAYSISFDWEFLSAGSNPAIGRHAGVNFGFNEVGNRFAGNTNGYEVFWIDRASDFGLSLFRFDGGTFQQHNLGTGGLFTDPPSNIRIEVDETNIRVFGDDVLAIDVADSTYRGGVSGLWTWTGDQEVAFDNFTITQVPEPSSLALLCLGSFLALRIRKRGQASFSVDAQK